MAAHKDASVVEYETRLKKNPSSLVFARLADSYRINGNIQQAIDVCSNGIAMHPDSITGRLVLGRCFLDQDRIDEAIQEYTKVIEHDRLNQVALKMLADSFAGKGIRDKAGDLYSYLLFMNPGDQFYVNLVNNFPGTGKTDILDILDVSSVSQEISDSSGGRVETAQAAVDDSVFTNTMPLKMEEIVSGDTGEQLLQTVQLDAEDLEQAEKSGSAQPVDIKEPSQVDENNVTGDDISRRMTDMFEEPLPSEGVETVPESAAFQTEASASEQEIPVTSDTAVQMPEISGNDISSRIDQLFSDKPSQDEAVQQDDFTRIYDPADASGTREINVIPVDIEEPAMEPSVNTVKTESRHDEAGDVSGEDVVSRITELFALPDETPSIKEVPGGTFADSIVADDTSELTNEKITVEKDTRDTVMNSYNGGAVAGEEKIDLPAEVDPAEPGVLVSEKVETISGDDIAERLDSIFDDNSVQIVSQLSSEDADIADNQTETGAVDNILDIRSVKDHEFGEIVNTAMSDDVVESDGFDSVRNMLSEMEINEPDSSGDMVITGTPADIGTVENFQINEQEQSRHEENPAETEQAEPDFSASLSGNDVISRLDELFPEQTVSAVPEENSAEEKTAEEFYSMPSEAAGTDVSEDPFVETKDDPIVPVHDIISEESSGELDDGGLPKVTFAEDELFADSGEKSVSSIATEKTGESLDEKSNAVESSPEYCESPKSSEFSIPDHVITPTLADIYFQQGQPLLAVQIYERLLNKDPDNERIIERIEEIKKFIVETGWKPDTENKKKPDEQRPKRTSRQQRSSGKNKPLTGVRIKKGSRRK
jgi:pilus assembly protein FimV